MHIPSFWEYGLEVGPNTSNQNLISGASFVAKESGKIILYSGGDVPNHDEGFHH
jgi:hypothetical protein